MDKAEPPMRRRRVGGGPLWLRSPSPPPSAYVRAAGLLTRRGRTAPRSGMQQQCHQTMAEVAGGAAVAARARVPSQHRGPAPAGKARAASTAAGLPCPGQGSSQPLAANVLRSSRIHQTVDRLSCWRRGAASAGALAGRRLVAQSCRLLRPGRCSHTHILDAWTHLALSTQDTHPVRPTSFLLPSSLLSLSLHLSLTTQGRVRTKTVKKASRNIIEKYYGRLTLDFATNQRICEEVAIIQSKRLRNKIAGFTTVRCVVLCAHGWGRV